MSTPDISPLKRHVSETVQNREVSYCYAHLWSHIRALHWY